METRLLQISTETMNISDTGILWSQTSKRLIPITIITEDGEEKDLYWINYCGRFQFVYKDSMVDYAFGRTKDVVVYEHEPVRNKHSTYSGYVYDRSNKILHNTFDRKSLGKNVQATKINAVGMYKVGKNFLLYIAR